MANDQLKVQIFSRAVSSGNTQVDKESKKTVDNPFASQNSTKIWGNRLLDEARLAKKEEFKKKALFNFEKTFLTDDDTNDKPKEFIG